MKKNYVHDDKTEQPEERQHDRRLWVIGLCIASLVFIGIILFANKDKGEGKQASAANTAVPADADQVRLRELEERERRARALENAQDIIDREYRNNWPRYITHKASDYKVGFFGGIKDLEITVTNNTEGIVDEMVIEVEYIRESGKAEKTSEVVFNNIQPGTSKTEKAPETSRGIKINTAITRITARSFSFCYDATKRTERQRLSPADPWVCK